MKVHEKEPKKAGYMKGAERKTQAQRIGFCVLFKVLCCELRKPHVYEHKQDKGSKYDILQPYIRLSNYRQIL